MISLYTVDIRFPLVFFESVDDILTKRNIVCIFKGFDSLGFEEEATYDV